MGEILSLARFRDIFRNCNERIGEAADALGQEKLTIFCECGSSGCSEKLQVHLADYKRARSHSERFLLATGHGSAEVDRVIEGLKGCSIIERAALIRSK